MNVRKARSCARYLPAAPPDSLFSLRHPAICPTRLTYLAPFLLAPDWVESMVVGRGGGAWQEIGEEEEHEAGMFILWLLCHRTTEGTTQAGCGPQLKVSAPVKMTLPVHRLSPSRFP